MEKTIRIIVTNEDKVVIHEEVATLTSDAQIIGFLHSVIEELTKPDQTGKS